MLSGAEIPLQPVSVLLAAAKTWPSAVHVATKKGVVFLLVITQPSAGAISKTDLKRFLDWAGRNLGYPSLLQVNEAKPTAELEPIREGVAAQTDEQDMGMTYEELSIYGRLRKLSRCGPVSMFGQLLVLWKDRLACSICHWSAWL